MLSKRTVSNQALKPIGSIMGYDNKYSNLNKKIRDILDKDQQVMNRSPLQQELTMSRSTFTLKRV